MVRTKGQVMASSRSRFTSMPLSTIWRLYSSCPPTKSAARVVFDTPTVRAMIWQMLLRRMGLVIACARGSKSFGLRIIGGDPKLLDDPLGEHLLGGLVADRRHQRRLVGIDAVDDVREVFFDPNGGRFHVGVRRCGAHRPEGHDSAPLLGRACAGLVKPKVIGFATETVGRATSRGTVRRSLGLKRKARPAEWATWNHHVHPRRANLATVMAILSIHGFHRNFQVSRLLSSFPAL